MSASQNLPTPQTPAGRPSAPEADAVDQPFWRQDLGMATAEYAIATLAACGFAGLLLIILRSDEVRAALAGIITRALSLA